MSPDDLGCVYSVNTYYEDNANVKPPFWTIVMVVWKLFGSFIHVGDGTQLKSR